jgi:calcium/calmodulin-dependent protein kinase I
MEYIEKILNKPFVSVFSQPGDKLWQKSDLKSKEELIVRNSETCFSHNMFKIGSDADLRPLRPKQFYLNGKKLYYADPCEMDHLEAMMDLPFTVVEFIEPKPKKPIDGDYMEVVGVCSPRKFSESLSMKERGGALVEEYPSPEPKTKKDGASNSPPQTDQLLLEVMTRKLNETGGMKTELVSLAQKPNQDLYIIRFYRHRKFTEIGTYQLDVFRCFQEKLKKVCINTSLLGSFKILRKLCWDQYSRSCIGIDYSNETEVFIRTIEKDSFTKSSRSAAYAKSQIESLRLLDTSPWLAGLHYVFEDASYVHLIFSYCAGPRLDESLKLKPQFKESDLRDFCCELILGIEYLHSRQIVHGNISPDTIILHGVGKPGANNLGRITSFRNLTSVAKGPPPFPLITKPGFIAPEILNTPESEIEHLNYYKADIFSLGSVIYYMMVGTPPFKGNSLLEILEANKAGSLRINTSSFQGFSQQWVSLIISMLEASPDARPSASDCLRVLQVQSHLNLFATADCNRPKLNKKNLKIPGQLKPCISLKKNIQISEHLRESIFTSVFCTSKFTYDNQYPVLIGSKNLVGKVDASNPSNRAAPTILVEKSISSTQPAPNWSVNGGRPQTTRPNLASGSIGWNSYYGGGKLTDERDKLSDDPPLSEPVPKVGIRATQHLNFGGQKRLQLNLDQRKEILSESSFAQKIPSLPQGLCFGIKNLNEKVVMSERKADEITKMSTVPEREIDKPRLRIRMPPTPKRMKDLE